MSDSELENYNQKFKEIINSFEEFIHSRQYRLLKPEDAEAPSSVLNALGGFLLEKLQQDPNPEKMLHVIRILDDIYFKCLLKNEICSSIFEVIFSSDKTLFSKFKLNLPQDLKKELERWMQVHGKDIFKS